MPSLPSSIDDLNNARNEAEYQETLIRLLREKSAVDLNRVELPSSPGLPGKVRHLVRKVLWKLFRYQHEQVTIQHNAVHELQAAALEYQHDLFRKRIGELEQKLDRLETSRRGDGT